MSSTNNIYSKNFNNQSGIVTDNIVVKTITTSSTSTFTTMTAGSLTVTNLYHNGPIFSANSSNQTLPANINTNTVIIQPNIEFNVGSCYNSSTGRFTPNVAGYYEIKAKIYFNNQSNNAIVSIFKNGAAYKILQQCNGTGGFLGAGGSCIVYCNGTTDYLTMCGSSNGISILSGQSAHDNFEGYYLRSG
jgi:hypothetical protein